MAGAMTDAGADRALDAVTGRATATARTMYLDLRTSDPGRTGTPATAGEYAATGYSRQTYTAAAPSTTGNNRKSGNTALLTFGPLTGANGSVSITHAALVSTASGTSGEMTYRWQFDTARSPAAGDSITVAIDGVNAQITVTPLA
jgi:hypothetical protein